MKIEKNKYTTILGWIEVIVGSIATMLFLYALLVFIGGITASQSSPDYGAIKGWSLIISSSLFFVTLPFIPSLFFGIGILKSKYAAIIGNMIYSGCAIILFIFCCIKGWIRSYYVYIGLLPILYFLTLFVFSYKLKTKLNNLTISSSRPSPPPNGVGSGG